jgi:pimeloyl-ACP methyl ester carboxylesterase
MNSPPFLQRSATWLRAAAASVALIAIAGCRTGSADGLAQLQPCRIPGVEREVRCGSVTMPEDPDTPASRALEIRFAVVPAVARNKQPDPVFVLAGGPGQAATRVARQMMPVLNALNARRDIVFIDQRGTGGSNALECEVDETSLASALEPSAQIARLADCLKALPADLRQYATWIAVRDFDAVRAALGATAINLWGGSYGTRAALEYLRQFPQHVRSVVLDGVAPPDMALPASFAPDSDAALTALAAACDADARCRDRYPHFDERIGRLLAAAERGIELRIPHPLTGAIETLLLDRRMVASLLRVPMYAPSLAAVLPYALAEAGRGDYTALVALSAAVAGSLNENFATGMHFAVVCAEDMPRVDAAATQRAAATRFGTAFIELYRQACRNVPTRPVPPEFYEVSAAQAPVLLLSGGLDPATPPRHGESVATRLGNARHLVAPNLGHGISAHGCAPTLIADFVRDASFARLDDTCLARIPAPAFFSAIEPSAARPKSSKRD